MRTPGEIAAACTGADLTARPQGGIHAGTQVKVIAGLLFVAVGTCPRQATRTPQLSPTWPWPATHVGTRAPTVPSRHSATWRITSAHWSGSDAPSLVARIAAAVSFGAPSQGLA